MAEVESLEIPRARRREIALAMIEAIRNNAQHGAHSNLSPPGALVLLELLDEQKAEVAKVREEASNLAQKLAAVEGDGAGDREAEAETDHRTICRLMKDLEEERTWTMRLRAQLEQLRAFVPQTRDDANELREQVAKLELEVKCHRDIAEVERQNAEDFCKERNEAFAQIRRLGEDYAQLKASTKGLVEQANARAFSTERELVDAQQRLQQARADLAAALNDRQLMELRLADMSERFEDLHELVVVIDLGEQIL